jgi:hypothetical protein
LHLLAREQVKGFAEDFAVIFQNGTALLVDEGVLDGFQSETALA